MKLLLLDAADELPCNHFGAPPKKAPDGREVADAHRYAPGEINEHC